MQRILSPHSIGTFSGLIGVVVITVHTFWAGDGGKQSVTGITARDVAVAVTLGRTVELADVLAPKDAIAVRTV